MSTFQHIQRNAFLTVPFTVNGDGVTRNLNGNYSGGGGVDFEYTNNTPHKLYIRKLSIGISTLSEIQHNRYGDTTVLTTGLTFLVTDPSGAETHMWESTGPPQPDILTNLDFAKFTTDTSVINFKTPCQQILVK